jgi:hypothetical protein
MHITIPSTTPNAQHNSFYLNWMVDIQVLSRAQPILPSKTWFFGIYLKISVAEIIFKSISHTFWIQILPNKFHKNPAHQDLSINTKRQVPILSKFSATISFNFQWKYHSIFKNFFTGSPNAIKPKPMHPSSRAFKRHQEHNMKHLSLMDLITTMQNKLPSFIDRFLTLQWKIGCWKIKVDFMFMWLWFSSC